MNDPANGPGPLAGRAEIAGDNVLLSVLLDAVRSSGTMSRSDLARDTGLGKALVAQYVEQLLQSGLAIEMGVGESRGGRKPRVLRFASERGLIGAVDLGATSLDVAVTDLSARVVAHRSEPADVTAGPEPVLQRVVAILTELLDENGFDPRAMWGIGMGVPGPVEFSTGLPVSPPIMPGWNAFPIRRYFGQHFSCPVYVDNDVNILAVGEASAGITSKVDNSIFVKIGTGIGSGIIIHGRIYRGSQGSAGDIGHIQVDNTEIEQTICRCGNLNCLEALAGGAALSRAAERAARSGLSAPLLARLNEKGFLSAEDIAEMAAKGDAWSTEQIWRCGRQVGYILAGLVNFANPSMIIIGGGVANFGDRLLAAIREMIYKRSLPLATRSLRIERSSLGSMGGVIGAAHIVLDELFAPGNVITALNRGEAKVSVSV